MPAPAPGQVLIQVEAAALNPVDLRIAAGGFRSGTPELPYVPGSEGVGTVVEGSHRLKGKRVRFQTSSRSQGALAEWAVADRAACLNFPDELSSPVAAGLGVAGVAAWICLVDKARLQRGERVLILGATGVVGQLAVQIARLLGAGRVVAAGRDQKALVRTLELGADAVVALTDQSVAELGAEFAVAAEGPVQVVFDPVWGVPLEAAVAAAAPSARIVNLGQSAGDLATLSSQIVRGRQLVILGHFNSGTSPKQQARAFRELADHAARGRIQLEVEEVPLEEVTAAWIRQAASPHVKLVITPTA
ncbi:MAG TPA: zinc-binding alcohol dehydrogenase family protein [Candidatus Dormibacteraeota bacterium]|nr:zinc-binding alcohol dehydrogenase family protein [Candidatus Dormibacteraeota bacterium]